MDQERAKRLAELFHAASSVDEAHRQTYLDQLSGEDLPLKPELEELLEYHESATDGRFDRPARLNVAAQLADGEVRLCRETPDAMVGTSIGRYEIQSLIGRGGFGDVYLATRATDFNQKVAIKLLLRRLWLQRVHIAAISRRAAGAGRSGTRGDCSAH